MYKTLDRNELFEGFAVPDWATAAALFKGHWYFEESLEQLDGDRFERVGSGCTGNYGAGAIKGYGGAVLFTPLVEQDDPLPPAPESVMYFNSIRDDGNDQCLTVSFDENPKYAGTLCVSVHPRADYENCYSVSFDPDAALQLAHDLNRMANEIKRRERAQSGE